MLVRTRIRNLLGCWGVGLACVLATRPAQADGTSLGENYCPATVNSSGAAAKQTVFGPNHGGSGQVFLDDPVLLGAAPVPRGTIGLFIYGPSQGQLPFGDGVLCLSSPTQRLPALTSTGGGQLAQNITFSSQLGFAPGPWNFQAWFRDPNGGPAGFNLSNGLSLTLSP